MINLPILSFSLKLYNVVAQIAKIFEPRKKSSISENYTEVQHILDTPKIYRRIHTFHRECNISYWRPKHILSDEIFYVHEK